jgi:chorismate mutase
MAEERDLKAAPERDPASARAASEAEAAIEGLRRRIDSIDDQLMRLLNSRSACAVEIGRVKRALGLPVYSPEREAWILDRVMRENPGPLDAMAVRRVFERVIDESRRLERLAMDEEGHRAGEEARKKGEE